ncbi:MAG: YkgJ family cysteine cluster protein [Candidatus Korarchaeum sp.]|nr:YkgJ family cysteine cluster protein [Candidatus Korarchaeum sp.]MDW8035851.1 YkgJ family cysteine cluster protein [Candidatus Korarchaeum sp.]
MQCSDGCYACCLETEMILTEGDLKRIESLGYRREDFSEFRSGFIRLKNVEGKCYFLSEGRCMIYESRPLGCEAYPVVFNVTTRSCELDYSCPAIDTVGRKEFQNKCRIVTRIIKELGI